MQYEFDMNDGEINSFVWMFRAMKADHQGLPVTGETARTLGARPGVDITEDASGMVHAGPAGMSVTLDDPMQMPKVRRPQNLGGSSRDPLFCMRVSRLSHSLRLSPPSSRDSWHGCITPGQTCLFREYQHNLHLTRPCWEMRA